MQGRTSPSAERRKIGPGPMPAPTGLYSLQRPNSTSHQRHFTHHFTSPQVRPHTYLPEALRVRAQHPTAPLNINAPQLASLPIRFFLINAISKDNIFLEEKIYGYRSRFYSC